MSTLEVIKSTLAEHNHGRSRSANNARCTGSTVCWAVRDSSGSFLGGDHWFAVTRKRDAQALCAHFNQWDEDVWNASGVDTFISDTFDGTAATQWVLDIKEV